MGARKLKSKDIFLSRPYENILMLRNTAKITDNVNGGTNITPRSEGQFSSQIKNFLAELILKIAFRLKIHSGRVNFFYVEMRP